MVGDARRLTLPDVGRGRAGSHRLRGLRLVHTHLDGEPLTRDDHTDLALLRLDSVAALEVREDGQPGRIHLAWLIPGNPAGANVHPAGSSRRPEPLVACAGQAMARRAATS